MLVSKWASDENLAAKAKDQDTKGSSPKKLESKWADVEEPLSLPTPPSSRDKNKKKGKKSFSKKPSNLANSCNGTTDNEDNNIHMSEAAKSLARRLSISDTSTEDHYHERSVPNHEHQSRNNKNFKKRPGHLNVLVNKTNNNHQQSKVATDNNLEDSDDAEKLPPMSAAALSFAAHLGMVDNNRKLDKGVVRSDKKFTPSKPKREVAERRKRKDKELAINNNEKKEDLDQQHLKDEEMRKQVSAMFEKMSNKQTNWADLEDDDF